MPIITFVNKMDRESQDPFALLDEVSSTLALDCVPANWPVGMGHDFKGCYDLFTGRLLITGKENKNLEPRSEEHTSELQSLMRISYAVFCLKKKTSNTKNQ